MIKIKQIKEKEIWESFVLDHKFSLFVQSWNYGEFYESIGENFWVFGIYEDSELIGGALVLSTHAKRGNYLYIPYGPIIKSEKFAKSFPFFTDFIKDFAKKEKYSFVKISPFIDDNEENRGIFSNLNYRPSPLHALAEDTWILRLDNKELNGLLADMKKNHRNLIRRCVKEDVRIEKSQNKRDLGLFNKIHDETAKRHNFQRFSKDYIKKEFLAFKDQNFSLLFNAYLSDNQIDSSSIFMFYGNMASYRHSGSLSLEKKIPTSYLVQWEAIKEAKKRGIKYYNFWGIAPEGSSKKHPFYGISHFKRGFGGREKRLLHCQDLPVSYKYWLNWVIEKIRKIKRGF